MAGQATLSTVQALYLAYYGRPADPEGLSFWADVVEANGGNTNVIINDFASAPEYQERFGSLDNQELVNNLYLQMFGRDAEPDGLAFWTGLLSNGSQTLGQIAQTISSLASGIDLQVLDGRVELSNAFTAQLNTPEKLAAYGSTNGIAVGRSFLDQIKGANVGDVASIVAKAAESAAALTPTTGGSPTPTPTLGTSVSAAGVLSFTGTATGNITIETSTNGDLTFTRGTSTTTLTKAAFSSVTSLAEQSSSLVITAKGAPSIDLLTTLDTSGATLSYSNVGDTAARLATDAQSNAGAGTFLKVGITAAVTDDSSISKLSTLSDDIGRAVAGLNITDTAANIMADVHSNFPSLTLGGLPSLPFGYTHSYIDSTIGSNIEITGQSTVYQAGVIDSINGNGSLDYSISDYLSDIANNYTIAKNADSVTVSNTNIVYNATVDTIKNLLSLTNVVGGRILLEDFVFTLRDTAQHLIDAAGTDIYVAAFQTNGQNITVDPAATINEANTLVTMDLTYTISDTYAHFDIAGSASAAVLGAYSLTVTGTAADIQEGQTKNAAFFDALGISDRLVVTGSTGAQTIKGTLGGDEIHGGAGDDIISGGNDQNGDSSDSLFGDEGNDTITVGEYSSVYGDDGDDTITAGDHSYVSGGEGNDTITAGAADIYGGTGDDVIVAGSSYVYGGDGNDTITAGDESVINGNDGDDNITATTKSDVYGGTGNDTITAGVSNEIYGDDGNDTITGGGTIYGGAGADNITGNGANDVFAFHGASAAELIAESGTTTGTFDFITGFSSGDSIQFDHVSSLQLVQSSTSGTTVAAGTLGLSASLSAWSANSQTGSLLSIDIADASGEFDGTVDMEIILVGVTNPSLSVQGNSLTFIIPV